METDHSQEGKKTITATKGALTISFVLYGEVSDERLVREQAILKHRLEMLS